MENLNKETLELMTQAYLDEFDLWGKTEGNTILPSINGFLKKVVGYNILIFNTEETVKSLKTHLVKDEATQEGVLTFLLRVKFRFISYGGSWDLFITTLKEISNSISKDDTFGSLEGYNSTSEISENKTIQALLYYYVLSPNILILRGNYDQEA